MELEEAAKSGLDVLTDVELGFYDRYKKAEGNSIRATALHWSDVLLRLGLSAGRIGLYGTWQVNQTIALYEALKARTWLNTSLFTRPRIRLSRGQC